MPSAGPAIGPSRARVLAAFAAVYLVWGSTYLAIRFATETLPPFLMAGVRFAFAGMLLYAWRSREPSVGSARVAGRAGGRARPPRPSLAEWASAFVVGALLVFGGNGAVVWATGRVPSGIIALLVATAPIFIVAIDWLRPRGVRPGGLVAAGLLLGTGGITLLVSARGGTGGRIDPLGAAVVLGGSLSWAIGSLASRSRRLPSDPLRSAAMQMVGGGLCMIAAGLASGEVARTDLSAVSLRSAAAWLYLVIFGSIVAYPAYIWLLGHVAAARVATYAYVNPVVAVALGWALAGERVGALTLLAAAAIVVSVALITAGQRAAPAHDPTMRPSEPVGHAASRAVN